MLSYHAFEDETMHFRLQQAQQHRNRLARTLQGRGGLRLEQRRRIWLVCVQTSQLYGLSAVGITEAGYNLLRIQTMKHVRAFAKSPRHLTQESDRSLLDRLGLCAPLQTLMQQVDGIYHRLEQPEFSTLPCYDNAGLLGWFRGIRDDLRLLATKTLGDSVTSEPPPEAGVQDVPTGMVFDPPVLPATEGTTTVKTHEGRAHKKFAPKRVVADIVSYSLNGLPTCKLCRASFACWTGLRRHIEENRCPGLREEPVPVSPVHDAADVSGPRPSQATATATALDVADAAQPTTEGSLMATGSVAASTSSGPWDSGPAQAFESEPNHAKPSSEGADCSSWKQDALVSASVLRPAIQWDTVLSIRPPRWESIVRVPGIISNLQSYCGVCGKWIAEKKGMKRHWQKSHPELWNSHYPLVLHWCKHWAKSADADGQLRSLFGLMPALQAQQAQETGNSMDVDRTSTKRKDPATNTTRQGSQKGKGKGGRGKYGRGGIASHQKPSGDSEDSSDLRSLIQHMGRMVLQQAEATNRICLDSGFLLVLQTPPHPGSVTRALCQVGDAWKLKAKEAPTTLTMSLKMEILECLFRELVARANMTMNTPEAKTEAQRLGLLKEDCWTYRQWNPAKSENQTTMSKPVSHQEFCQGVEDFLAHIQKCDGLTRFKALQELTPETTNAAVPFLLDVSFRQDQIHATLVRWIGLSPFELIGARMRQVHAKASPQQTKLYEMLRNM
ncbi:unnamed protein product [Symbiodinium sp. CCMP2592]|nr:unnamed protein product [Symbiodinium sp. CCMP2592]